MGFCVKYMEEEPSMALCMEPQLFNKFIGFQVGMGGLC